MKEKLQFNSNFSYKRKYYPISGYTTTFNAVNMGYPFTESIKSLCGFCDEVVVVDGCSTDGTYEELEALMKQYPQIQVYQNEWDTTEPLVDSIQKAFARALCTHEFLWQQDVDECVHEDDYEKIKMITKRFPTEAPILHLPIIELWSGKDYVTARRHFWKWRLSRNLPEITHSCNKYARTTNPETGKVYSKKGMSDGCEYVDVMTYDIVPHVGFYNPHIEQIRLNHPEECEKIMNNIFEQLPSVFHYSWFNLPNKIKQLKKGGTWDKLWSLLYQEETQERFPGIDSDSQIKDLCKKLHVQGGEDSDTIKYKFKLRKNHPKLMKDWIEKNKTQF